MDNIFSVINIHQTTVAYMSLIVVFIVAIIILVYVYFKRGKLHCCLGEQHPAYHLPTYNLPTMAPRRYSHAYGNPRPSFVVELVRMEDGSEAVMKTFSVGTGKLRQ